MRMTRHATSWSGYWMNGWSVVKAASPGPAPKLGVDTVLALLYRGVQEAQAVRDLRLRVHYGSNGEAQEALRLGGRIAERLRCSEHKLTLPLSQLKEMIEAETGELLEDAESINRLRWQLRAALRIIRHQERHRQALQAISNYVGALARGGLWDGASGNELALVEEGLAEKT